MLGRPRKFDREQALDRAMDLFWKQGFEATGIAQLSEHLGIGRQSIYCTFGDKRSLYLEALGRYCDHSISNLKATLGEPGKALDNLNIVFDLWVKNARSEDYCGCFMASTISELGLNDVEMAEILNRNVARMTAAFEMALDKARSQGDLATDTDSHALARLLVNTSQGLSVSGKIDPGFAADVVVQLKKLLR